MQSIKRLTASPRSAEPFLPAGHVWDHRLGRAVCDAKRLRKTSKDKTQANTPWVVYISTDLRVEGLAERVATALRRTDECSVLVNGPMPPDGCARCVAVDAGRAQRCREHCRGPEWPRSTPAPPKGSFDVYASPCSLPNCYPPCVCGQIDGHASETEAYTGGEARRPPTTYRLFSRFADRGRHPTPSLVTKRWRRVVRFEEKPEDHADDLFCGLELDSMSPALAREFGCVLAAAKRLGPCRLSPPQPSERARRAEVEAPAPSSVLPQVPEDGAPEAERLTSALEGATARHLVFRFAVLRCDLRQSVDAFDPDDRRAQQRLQSLVEEWQSNGFSPHDAVLAKARRLAGAQRHTEWD